jgi:hypothetical protein
MRKTSVSVGHGITRYSKHQRVLDPAEQSEAEEIRQFLASSHDQLNQPWGLHRRLIAGLRESLDQIEARLLDPADPLEPCDAFVERETEGWYVLQAVRRANLIEKYIVSRPWEAVGLAYELGELVTEFAIKADLEKSALAGQKVLEAQLTASGARRRQPREARVAYVDRLVAQGHRKRRAFELAGAHFKVVPQTIRNDYYKK